MAKKYPDRPALTGIKVNKLLREGILKIQPIKQSPVLIVLEALRTRQTWFAEDKNKYHARSTVPTGTILVPSWKRVAAWRIRLYLENQLDLSKLGITNYRGKYYLLLYEQAEDLDHARRKCQHAREFYHEEGREFPEDLIDVFDVIVQTTHINMTIKERQKRLEEFIGELKKHVRDNHTRLAAIIDEPLEEKRYLTREIRTLREIITFCRSIKSRPMYRPLGNAARSLERAIDDLKQHDYRLARVRMCTGLKNMKYPEEGKTQTP